MIYHNEGDVEEHGGSKYKCVKGKTCKECDLLHDGLCGTKTRCCSGLTWEVLDA